MDSLKMPKIPSLGSIESTNSQKTQYMLQKYTQMMEEIEQNINERHYPYNLHAHYQTGESHIKL
jgi:hypothetical protein